MAAVQPRRDTRGPGLRHGAKFGGRSFRRHPWAWCIRTRRYRLDSDSNPYRHPDRYSNADRDRYTDPQSDQDSNGHSNCDSYADRNRHARPHPDADRDVYSKSSANCDPDRNRDGDSYADQHFEIHSVCYTYFQSNFDTYRHADR